jgi:hypothetical protein
MVFHTKVTDEAFLCLIFSFLSPLSHPKVFYFSLIMIDKIHFLLYRWWCVNFEIA